MAITRSGDLLDYTLHGSTDAD